jgi:hypothetical protein
MTEADIQRDANTRLASFRFSPPRGLNLVNALDCSENLCQSVKPKKAHLVKQQIKLAARSFQSILMHVKEIENDEQSSNSLLPTSSMSLLDSFFVNSWQRFGGGWRPDCTMLLELPVLIYLTELVLSILMFPT